MRGARRVHRHRLHRIADGRIVEDWTNSDALGLMRQIGVAPESDQ